MIFSTNSAGCLTYLSEDWERLTGQSLARAADFGWAEAVHPEDRALTRSVVATAIAAQSEFSVRYRVLRPDGTPVWVVGGGVPARRLHDDVFQGFIGSVGTVSAARAQPPVAGGRIGRFLGPLYADQSYGNDLEQLAGQLLTFNALHPAVTLERKPVSLVFALAEVGHSLAGLQRFRFGTQPH
ncbi:PAS domain-containing protein [Methylobacterium organophilum]|uniref:PAS domain-containing protein n=1 Tax=Methylobacterium organophilum TaxID=410 RepID=UPI001F142BB2|nr:PAS domain-containing protein [Methylobacterium organophilum]UMY16693.1 PAS domain-containing protein [Methylobacterium organophilum]